MKKTMAILLTALLVLCLASWSAAEGDGIRAGQDGAMAGRFEDGCYILTTTVSPEERGEWRADDGAENSGCVRLVSAGVEDGVFSARFEPVADGVSTVVIRHFTGAGCDSMFTYDLQVAGGAVTEVLSGSAALSVPQEELDPAISGEWAERDTQYTMMTIRMNAGGGWDAEAASPLTHGAYVFRATLWYDCEIMALVYEDGAVWNVPITAEENPDLGEPVFTGLTGKLLIMPSGDDERAALVWPEACCPESREIVFGRIEEAAD